MVKITEHGTDNQITLDVSPKATDGGVSFVMQGVTVRVAGPNGVEHHMGDVTVATLDIDGIEAFAKELLNGVERARERKL